MKKIITLMFAVMLGLSGLMMVSAAPQDTEQKVKHTTKRVTRNSYHHGRRIVRGTHHHGRKITRKVWHRGKHIGKRTGDITKHTVNKIVH